MMFIDDQRKTGGPPLLSSPFLLALVALIGCGLMLLAVIKPSQVQTVSASPFPSVTALHVATLFSDPRIVFGLLLGGFVLMAGGCFVLSRRSLRDAVKAASRHR
ncbi:MAG TPA: hypothetical protein VGO22_18940 [Pseudorhizobium sp.]|jgi:hypothetical protein|nr:hypothetical protein [Pseudorhizobium sp.]